MGTRWELILRAEDQPLGRVGANAPTAASTRAFLQAAGEEAIDEVQRWHRTLSIFDRASQVSRINANAFAEPVRVDCEFFELLRVCLDARDETHGTFDIAAGSLMKQWGFRDQDQDSSPKDTACAMQANQSPNSANPRNAARELHCSDGTSEPSTLAFTLDATQKTIQFSHPQTSLDFGAIAKGWALDRVLVLLRDAGVEHAFIHGGTSSIAAIGSSSSHVQGWRVVVQGLCDVMLHDTCMSVSETEGRVVTRDNARRSHIMDPRTGRPVGHRASVAVVHPSATVAEMWSTAMILLEDSTLAPHGSKVWMNSATNPSPPFQHTLAQARDSGSVQSIPIARVFPVTSCSDRGTA